MKIKQLQQIPLSQDSIPTREIYRSSKPKLRVQADLYNGETRVSTDLIDIEEEKHGRIHDISI